MVRGCISPFGDLVVSGLKSPSGRNAWGQFRNLSMVPRKDQSETVNTRNRTPTPFPVMNKMQPFGTQPPSLTRANTGMRDQTTSLGRRGEKQSLQLLVLSLLGNALALFTSLLVSQPMLCMASATANNRYNNRCEYCDDYNLTKVFDDTEDNESALRSTGTFLSRVQAPPLALWLDGGSESLRSPCCGLGKYKNQTY
ncbi:hypothetical protein PoB_000743200 [Plakobranchus ocellatus]|uniref:Uncharacterized protein n=1 Tax=Plakobranchus ocellatus TaxID=259542 RepID=A0AAV3YDG9_9GAST|nr:hypothetical protein PoB_000743200 [Plakobranchus ocellatus]